jgi:hypothetical protein
VPEVLASHLKVNGFPLLYILNQPSFEAPLGVGVLSLPLGYTTLPFPFLP